MQKTLGGYLGHLKAFFVQMGKSEFIVPDSFLLINKSNGTNCKQVCKLYGGGVRASNQSELLKKPENQNEIHEANSNLLKTISIFNYFFLMLFLVWENYWKNSIKIKNYIFSMKKWV